ncbi:MAG: M28 family peptidase [Cryomorphaceae bacterium]|nr:MAG: M28 family peptidase [Cryomorphaceae bacterium]
MKKWFCLGVYTLALVAVGAAQPFDTTGTHYGKNIHVDSLRKYLEVIASDEFEGRETGKKGQKMAAHYIAGHFERLGLQKPNDSTYYQPFNVKEVRIDGGSIIVGGKTFSFFSDFYFYEPLAARGLRNFKSLHFLGYGVDDSLYSDYATIAKVPETAIIWEGEPVKADGDFLLTGSELNTDWSKDFSKKLDAARNRGVRNLLIVNEDFGKAMKRMGFYLTMPRMTLPKENGKEPDMSVFYISPSMAKAVLGKAYKPEKLRLQAGRGKAISFEVAAEGRIEVLKEGELIGTENVLGMIEGSSLKDEYLILTAHYDHLGMQGDDVYNGADDDGSGTVALMEMARVLAEARDQGYVPMRSVVFLAVSGEEKGLLGSDYYTRNPVYPLEQTVANLNVDMIGRNDDRYEPDSRYVYLIGSDKLSSVLHEISEKTNEECCNITLDYKYNDPNDPNRFYYRSDHYNFIKNDIPAIFYFSGVHEDYHKPGDTADKIQYGKMRDVVALIFNTAWSIANTRREITVDVVDAP